MRKEKGILEKNKRLMEHEGPPSDVERIKRESNYLRGTLKETMADPVSAGIPDDDNRLLKFHGSYLQDDRDLRIERQRQKLEPAYQFMVRVRAPGGVATPEQWLVLDELARKYANGSLRLTTRQSFQLHGVLKWNMKTAIQQINEALLSTLGACGDVNRNVMCNPNPHQSHIHAEVYEWSKKLSEHLSPQTNAYHEIWLDGEKVVSTKESEEPLYKDVYLPRKFKIGIAVPPSNDIDVYSQDLGFIAIVENGRLAGFNVAVGGGMGMTDGDPYTYPQLASAIGFCPAEKMVEVAEKVVAIQRDFGNRSVRKYARFKYTIDDRGLDWFVNELHKRLGWTLEEKRPYQFLHNGDRYGWTEGSGGSWHYTLFVENGRIRDFDDYPLMTGLREIAAVHQGDFRLTPNQNVIIANVSPDKKDAIEALIESCGLANRKRHSPLRKHSMACVALPTCGLAKAESERYLPTLLDKIEKLFADAGLPDEEVVIRMSGCPNGCSRPALAEIAFIGKSPGKYNMYLGGSFNGERLNKLYRENAGESEIIEALQPIINHYAKEKQPDEHFGDFVIRCGYVKKVLSGQDFHA